jgi:hypothetical protein
MQRLEVSGAVRPLCGSLGVEGLIQLVPTKGGELCDWTVGPTNEQTTLLSQAPSFFMRGLLLSCLME